ncbi:MAG: DUF2605 domain-containing protein [Microcoleaceae cyanobacterium]
MHIPEDHTPEDAERRVLKSVLQPLLEDFQYWFARSQQLLEQETMPFLSSQEQLDLLHRIQQAQQEVNSSKSLFQATGGQVGIEMAVLVPWHHLLTECWQVSARFRTEQSQASN